MSPAQLSGSSATGTLQIAEGAINDLLRLSAGRQSPLTVVLQPGNRILVRYGMFHAHATLPTAMEPGDSPRLVVTLASIVIAWGLKAAVNEPFIEIHGKDVTIELAAIPAFAGWRDLWRHLRELTFQTVPGALRLGFVVAIGGRTLGPAENDARMV